MKNFLSSLKKNLAKNNLPFLKMFKVVGQIAQTDEFIKDYEKDIELELTGFPVWDRFLRKINGLGAPTAGPIIAIIGNIARFHSISALRKYSGWYPQDGKAVTKSSGTKVQYSPKMKQYLYDFVDGITKAKDPHYHGLYLQFKKEILEKHPEYEGRKATKKQRIEGIPMHIHLMARRKVIQFFITDLFCIWRDLDGLPSTVPWAFGPGGHDPEHYLDPLKHPYYEKP